MCEKILTISIASYNTEKFIEETINSLVIDTESMKKMEIIIVNDGSKDKTSEIAHGYEKLFPDSVIVIDKENGGYGSTINSSLAIASGKYYKLLDGDDWFNTDVLANFLNMLEKCEADIVITPYYEVRNSDKLVDVHTEIPSDVNSIEDLRVGNKFFAMHEITVKTDVLRNFDQPITEHCFYTDSEYVFYCFASAKTVARFSEPIYRYRLGLDGQSVSIQGFRKHHEEIIIVSKRIIQIYISEMSNIKGSQKEIMKFYLQHLFHNTFFCYMMLEEPKRFKQELVSFDQEIKNKYYEAYKIGSGSRLVKLARCFHYSFYGILCKIVMRKYIREKAA